MMEVHCRPNSWCRDADVDCSIDLPWLGQALDQRYTEKPVARACGATYIVCLAAWFHWIIDLHIRYLAGDKSRSPLPCLKHRFDRARSLNTSQPTEFLHRRYPMVEAVTSRVAGHADTEWLTGTFLALVTRIPIGSAGSFTCPCQTFGIIYCRLTGRPVIDRGWA